MDGNLRMRVCFFEGVRGSFCTDAGRRKFFLRMFRFQKAGSSKFSAARLVAADGPAPDALALRRRLLYWHQAGAFWGLQGFIRLKAVCPQILGVEQKTKNFQLFSRVTSEEKTFSAQLVFSEFTMYGFTLWIVFLFWYLV